MKYKKHIATGVLALSLLVGSSSAFADMPTELERVRIPTAFHQKQNRTTENFKRIKRHNIVGIISTINSNGFTIEIKNKKTGEVSSFDVTTNSSTTYKKNGLNTLSSDLVIGQKVIIAGIFDNTLDIVNASKVKVADNSHTRNIQ